MVNPGIGSSIKTCALCAHPEDWHFDFNKVAQPCKNGVYFKCGCPQFCEKFEVDPQSESGLFCKNCNKLVFDHIAIGARVRGRVGYDSSYKLTSMSPGDIAYKLNIEGIKICCQWTLFNFMRTCEKPDEIPLDSVLECAVCGKAGTMIVIEDPGFVLGPTWKWEYRK